MIDGFVKVNGINIHYYRIGTKDKPVIFFLHGVSDNGLCWSAVTHEFETDYEIIMTDARGHGQSDSAANGYSLELLAADVVGVIRELGLGQVILYGHSMGARTAMLAAARYPELVRAAVLEDPPLMLETDRDKLVPDWTGFKIMLNEFKSMTRDEQIARGKAMNPDWMEEEIPPWSVSKAEFNIEVLDNLGDFEGSDWGNTLAKIECPILLLTADLERGAMVSPEAALQASQHWKNGTVKQIQGAGHSIHRDRFPETMAEVKAFLGKVV